MSESTDIGEWFLVKNVSRRRGGNVQSCPFLACGAGGGSAGLTAQSSAFGAVAGRRGKNLTFKHRALQAGRYPCIVFS